MDRIKVKVTDKASLAVSLAFYESSLLGQRAVKAEHLLLGLVQVDPQLFLLLSPAETNILSDIRRALGASVEGHRAGRSTIEAVPFASSVEEVLKLAADESHSLRHDYLGTEHVLLGLLKSRQRYLGFIKHGPSRVSRVLGQHGFTAMKIEARVRYGSITPQSAARVEGSSIRVVTEA